MKHLSSVYIILLHFRLLNTKWQPENIFTFTTLLNDQIMFPFHHLEEVISMHIFSIIQTSVSYAGILQFKSNKLFKSLLIFRFGLQEMLWHSILLKFLKVSQRFSQSFPLWNQNLCILTSLFDKILWGQHPHSKATSTVDLLRMEVHSPSDFRW